MKETFMAARSFMKRQERLRIRNRLADNQVHSARDLAWSAMIEESSDTYPRTRALIKEMIQDGELIGSNSKGYFNMRDAHEIQRYMNALMKRQIGLGKRIQAIFNAGVARGILK
jgi:hypothetical protein